MGEKDWTVGVITITHDGDTFRLTTTSHPVKGWMQKFTDDVAAFVGRELVVGMSLSFLGAGLVSAGDHAKAVHRG